MYSRLLLSLMIDYELVFGLLGVFILVCCCLYCFDIWCLNSNLMNVSFDLFSYWLLFCLKCFI